MTGSITVEEFVIGNAEIVLWLLYLGAVFHSNSNDSYLAVIFCSLFTISISRKYDIESETLTSKLLDQERYSAWVWPRPEIVEFFLSKVNTKWCVSPPLWVDKGDLRCHVGVLT